MFKKKTQKILFPISLFILCLILTIYSIYWESIEPAVIIFWDYFVYYSPAIQKFWNSEVFYGLNYFPSFFFLTPFYINLEIYIVFLTCCWIGSIYLLFKLEKNYFVVLIFSFFTFVYILIGNIEPFSIFILLIAFLYEEDKYIPPILLAFICFKLTMFLIIPYFLYKANNRILFIIIFISAFLLLNIQFLFHIDYIFQFFSLGIEDEDLSSKFIRVSLFYTLYYIIKEFRLTQLSKKLESKISERNEKEYVS